MAALRASSSGLRNLFVVFSDARVFAISAQSYSLLVNCSLLIGEQGTVGILLFIGIYSSLSFLLELSYGKMKNYYLFELGLCE